jgi:hypothetical protein
MKYRHRLIERKLQTYVDSFACVLLSGARQVGKSTTLATLFGEAYRTFVFDPVQDLYGVREDPDLFLRNNRPPLILDEIQYVPELAGALKRAIDRDRRPGMYLITGSQQWHVMRDLGESLAGRIAIIQLPAFCFQEAAGLRDVCWLNRWLEAARNGVDAGFGALCGSRSAGHSATEAIWRGGFPEVQELVAEAVPGWMQGYLSTYLLRDVRRMLEVRDETQFAHFTALCAALTAQECNFSQLGRDIGLASPTARRWIGVLRSTYQWLEVPAFAPNHIKRLSSRPKGYVTDTGLASFLMRLSSPAAVQGHPAFGALFETLVVTEMWKQLHAMPLMPALYHYRQHSGAEVDLVLELDGLLFPVEIKAASHVSPKDTRGIETFRERIGPAVQPGLVVYAGAEVLRLGEACVAVPFDLMP